MNICMNNITIVKDVKFANAITHDGEFHADDVLATVILSKVIKPLKIYRTNTIPDYIDSSIIVYDIGMGKFDHHQKNRNGTRENGVPYASAGLMWKEYGARIVSEENDPFLVWQYIDRDFIQGVDASDNFVLPKINYPTNIIGFDEIISSFNPLWNNEEDIDIAFMKAVEFTNTIFNNVYASAVAKSKAKQIIDEAIYKSDDHVIILPNNIPWKEFMMKSRSQKAFNIYFVIYPSLRGGYIWECVPKNSSMKEYRKPVPFYLRGLGASMLRKITGIKTATFCDASGSSGGAETLEDTIKFVKLALNN